MIPARQAYSIGKMIQGPPNRDHKWEMQPSVRYALFNRHRFLLPRMLFFQVVWALHRVLYLDSKIFTYHHQDQEALRSPFVSNETVDIGDNDIMRMSNVAAPAVKPDLHDHSMVANSGYDQTMQEIQAMLRCWGSEF